MPIRLVILMVLAANLAHAETPHTPGRLHNILDKIVRRHPQGDTKLGGQLIFTVNVDTWSAGSYRSKEFTLTVNGTTLSAL